MLPQARCKCVLLMFFPTYNGNPLLHTVDGDRGIVLLLLQIQINTD